MCLPVVGVVAVQVRVKADPTTTALELGSDTISVKGRG